MRVVNRSRIIAYEGDGVLVKGWFMMYSNKFVVSVLVNGQVIKEFENGEVQIPFNCEYSLRFRNKHDRRAVVKLFIDGEEQTKGGYIIPARSYRDIERNSYSPAKFKFVDLQSVEAQDHGKDQHNLENKMGVIEARFYLEQPPRPSMPPWLPILLYENQPPPKKPPIHPYPCTLYASNHVDYALDGGQHCNNVQQRSKQLSKEGCTVEGTYSSQQFGEMHLNLENDYTSIKLFLKGYQQPVHEVAVAANGFCDSCGAKALRDSSKFCHICGSKL